MPSVSTPALLLNSVYTSPQLPHVQERTAEGVLTTIEAWPYWNEIERVVAKEYGMPRATCRELLPEYQKFLALILLGHSPLGMFSAAIDQIWHSHVLAMHLYSQFCLTVHGKMILHVPQVPDPYTICNSCAICTTCRSCTNCSGGDQGGGDGDGKGMGQVQQQTREQLFFHAYTRHFGDVPLTIWNLPNAEGLCMSA